ncbi:MAG: carboxypeptidase-like regulatory domain-containing protein [Paludibacter sp.]|nr:carboxypeptidase-like regulatory domain-containing protein [Paludibacter sp.]
MNNYIYRTVLIWIFFSLLNERSVQAGSHLKLLSGTISDSQSGELLIGASIFDQATNTGTITDTHGHYALWISQNCDSSVLEISYLGYSVKKIKPDCHTNIINIKLEPLFYNLPEFAINAYEQTTSESVHSSFSMNKKELDNFPGIAGEKDLLKYLQFSPGVQMTGDGNANLYVRGGSSDQNLFLLDDIPLFHVSHLGNITSTFNSDMIKTAELYTGGFPAEYGGRLSSVLDVRTKDGDIYNHHQQFTIGLLTSKILAEGPILKGKVSYVASIRVNTMPLLKWLYNLKVDFSMYDINLKLNYIISPEKRLYFSFYNGNDHIKTNIDGSDGNFTSAVFNSWGNSAFSLRYYNQISQILQLNLTAGKTKYHYQEKNNIVYFNYQENPADEFYSNFVSEIADNFIIIKTNYSLSNKMKLQSGYDFFYHTYQPGQTIIKQSGIDFSDINIQKGYASTNSSEHSLFADFNISDFLGFSLYTGLRENILISQTKTFHDIQPRIIVSKKIHSNLIFKFLYSKLWQPFHLLTNNGAGVPADYRIPAMEIAPPSESRQEGVNLSYFSPDRQYEFSVEMYYKKMDKLTDLKEGVAYTLNYDNWSDILATAGKGISKGLELMLRKTGGRSTGWVGITLSNSTRQFPDLNSGLSYPYKYDRLLAVKCLFQQQLTNKMNFSATWVYGSGTPYNIPQSQFKDIEGNTVLIYGNLNEFRQKSYHRLDVDLSYKTKVKKHECTIDLSIINVYNRRNPYIYTIINQDEGAELYSFTLIPVLPTVSFEIKL